MLSLCCPCVCKDTLESPIVLEIRGENDPEILTLQSMLPYIYSQMKHVPKNVSGTKKNAVWGCGIMGKTVMGKGFIFSLFYWLIVGSLGSYLEKYSLFDIFFGFLS